MPANENIKAQKASVLPADVKKPYETPHLVRFGTITALTAGGSGNAAENANPDNPNRRP